MNLLIVDDHAGIRQMLRELLEHVATQIRECASGEEAVALCEQYTPDCVTVDLRMGEMDGLTCVKLLRERHPTAHIAVVTQFDHDALRTRARFAGADTYVLKDDLESLTRFVELIATRLGE